MSADIVTRADLRVLERRLTIRIGSMLMIAVGLLLAALAHPPS